MRADFRALLSSVMQRASDVVFKFWNRRTTRLSPGSMSLKTSQQTDLLVIARVQLQFRPNKYQRNKADKLYANPTIRVRRNIVCKSDCNYRFSISRARAVITWVICAKMLCDYAAITTRFVWLELNWISRFTGISLSLFFSSRFPRTFTRLKWAF